MSFNNIPAAIKDIPQWLLWRPEERTNAHGKRHLDKIPYSAKSGKRSAADSLDHTNDWVNFNTALTFLDAHEDEFKGLEFCFSNTGYFGIDFDYKAKGGVIVDPEVEKWVKTFNTYTEFSTSGKGVHVIGKSSLD